MPNRIIKESAFTSDKIAALSDFEFRLWVGLITQADDAGRGDARPAIIKGRVFPLRDRVTVKDIDNALHALAAHSCVSLYKVGGKPYYAFPGWAAHQRVRDAKPKYPAPENGDDFDNSPQSAATRGEPPRSAALIQSNPIQSNPIQSESNPNTNPNTNPTRARAIADVVAAYSKKISATPSTQTLAELESFVASIGPQLCLKAIDIAVDAGAKNWRYIRAILVNWRDAGFRTPEDVDRAEEARKSKKGEEKGWDFHDFAGNG